MRRDYFTYGRVKEIKVDVEGRHLKEVKNQTFKENS